MYVLELIKIVHFLRKYNPPINELYQPLLHSLHLILKSLYLDSHTTADSLISALNKFKKKETDAKLQHISDATVFNGEVKSVARKEIVDIFLSC